jgi:GTP-binding protein
MVRIVSAEFETSAAEPIGWPAADGAEAPAEIAFVGRSNVGKSSLMNTLVSRKGLARTSAEPGRTRLVNFFRVELIAGPAEAGRRLALRLVDLPGFGYARVSRQERSSWRPAIQRYLEQRRSLSAVVLLFDPRRVPGAGEAPEAIAEELELLRWIAAGGIRVIPTLTKCDKLAKHERTVVAERLRRLAGRPPVLASALSGEGRERLWEQLLAAAAAPRATAAAPLDGPATPGLTPPKDTD